MEDYSWIEAEIEEFEQDIAFKRARLEQYQYDEDTTNDIKISICVSKDIVASLKKQLPVKKLYTDGIFRCPGCGCVVNRYIKYCHYCGQKMLNEYEDREGIEGWNADK